MKKVSIFCLLFVLSLMLLSCNKAEEPFKSTTALPTKTGDEVIENANDEIETEEKITEPILETEEIEITQNKNINTNEETDVIEPIDPIESIDKTVVYHYEVPYGIDVNTFHEFEYFLSWFKKDDYKLICFNSDSSYFFGRAKYSFWSLSSEDFPLNVYEVTDEYFSGTSFFNFTYTFYSLDDAYYPGFNADDGLKHFKVTCLTNPKGLEFNENDEISFELTKKVDLKSEYRMYVGDKPVVTVKIELGKYTDESVISDIFENLKEIILFK